jgi:hypothetical protein
VQGVARDADQAAEALREMSPKTSARPPVVALRALAQAVTREARTSVTAISGMPPVIIERLPAEALCRMASLAIERHCGCVRYGLHAPSSSRPQYPPQEALPRTDVINALPARVKADGDSGSLITILNRRAPSFRRCIRWFRTAPPGDGAYRTDDAQNTPEAAVVPETRTTADARKDMRPPSFRCM